jgi:hypothetical protein
MNSKKVEALLEKYWEGSSNEKEELELKSFFSTKEGSYHKDSKFFHYLNTKKEDDPLDEAFDHQILDSIQKNTKSTGSVNFKYWYMAASIALLLTMGIIFKYANTPKDPAPQIVVVDTYEDPQKAFEETKKALLFLSTKLNQGSEYAAQLSKFEQSQEIIKQN